ncbi:hypothetical protein AQ806_30525 [Burkholderia pseudomallei]|nr:hypothetical protein AQ806_30525 [Burkholderia pseudomallei]
MERTADRRQRISLDARARRASRWAAGRMSVQIVAFGVKKDVSGNIGSGHRPFDDGLVECQHQVPH